MKAEIWVDGSFNNQLPTWAILVKVAGVEVHRASGDIVDPKLKRYNQIAGELEAAKQAIQWCLDNSVTEVEIHYDYEGIKAWAIKAWKANNEVTQGYAKYAQAAMELITIIWCKVKAHSGNAGNNTVDKLAKLQSTVGVSEIEDGIMLTYKLNKYKINFKELTIERN